MSSQVLQTKLYAPPVRPDLVVRPRLLERLDEGAGRRLTLVSAPAGFGKTTLVCAWAAGCDRPVGWVSLDEGDRAPPRFLRYVVAALQAVEAEVGRGALRLLEAPQPPPTETVLTALLNDVAALRRDVVLVLDDYHAVAGEAVDGILAYLLEQLPPRMHLIVTSRTDPGLPLARLRGRGELAEVRAADLRFTASEAAGFLERVTGLPLSAQEVAALEGRTEGWIAGLQLAALSLRGRADVGEFIEAFTGSHRFVLDYLVEEVLARQSDAVRGFLLRTAVLDRLHGALCDAVTGRDDGAEMLVELERGGLFLVPLDDERRWYRYHHLFADVLRARLAQEEPDRARELHRRASAWYERRDLPFDAIRHAFAAEEAERAADLVERAWPVMRRTYHEATLLAWARALPDDLLCERPVLNVYYAFALLSTEPAAAEPRLRDAERWLAATAAATDPGDGAEAGASAAGAVRSDVAADGERRSLPGMISVARAYQAGALRGPTETAGHARRALELLPAAAHLWRGSAAVLLGLAQWTGGELDSAQRSIDEALAEMRLEGDVSATISTAYLLADLQMAQGWLRRADRTIRRALALAPAPAGPVPQGTADLHVLASALQRERNELEAAARRLETSADLGEHAALQVERHRRYVAMAAIAEARGELDDALDLLDEAERVRVESPTPNVRPIAAFRARIWLAQGRLAEVERWVREQSLSVDDELAYPREFEHLTLARLRLAQYRSERRKRSFGDATDLLARLLRAAEAGARPGSAIEILILQALAHEARDDIAAALPPLRRALALAEPEEYVRRFIGEGPAMVRLLREAQFRAMAPAYVRRLLAAAAPLGTARTDDAAPPEPRRAPEPPPAEPLSGRELEVLERMAEGLTNQEIADRLGLALNTVKVHSRNIYGKLGVRNRTQAVTRGRALGILSGP